MAAPTTAEFEDLTFEVSKDNGVIWRKICGIADYDIDRSASVSSSKIPADCDDESKPYVVKKRTESIEVKVSGTGYWSVESHNEMMTWFYDQTHVLARIGHQKALSGTIQYEKGLCLLSSLSNSRTKGDPITAKIELEFSGGVELIMAA